MKNYQSPNLIINYDSLDLTPDELVAFNDWDYQQETKEIEAIISQYITKGGDKNESIR